MKPNWISYFAGEEFIENEDNHIQQSMHDLIDKKTGKDPTKSDVEDLKRSLDMFQFTDPDLTFHFNNNTEARTI